MENIVATVTSTLTPDAIMSVFGQVLPIALSFVPIVLGISLLRKVIKGISRGKVRV